MVPYRFICHDFWYRKINIMNVFLLYIFEGYVHSEAMFRLGNGWLFITVDSLPGSNAVVASFIDIVKHGSRIQQRPVHDIV